MPIKKGSHFLFGSGVGLDAAAICACTGNGVSVLEMIHAFEKATGVKLNYRIGPRRAGDAIAVYSSNKRAEEMLHWKPERSLEEMMRSAWEWEKAMNAKS